MFREKWSGAFPVGSGTTPPVLYQVRQNPIQPRVVWGTTQQPLSPAVASARHHRNKFDSSATQGIPSPPDLPRSWPKEGNLTITEMGHDVARDRGTMAVSFDTAEEVGREVCMCAES